MSHDALEERRLALEEQFFKQQNEALVNKLKTAAQRQATKAEIQRLTGINHDGVLAALAAMNVGGAAALVMSLYPLVEVAWADGKIEPAERRVVLEQAASVGLKAGSEASDLLAAWLDEKPDLTWHALWESFVKALVSTMSAGDKDLLKHEVLGRARLVAEASGGFLGLGWRVSATEQTVLDKLAKAFA